MRLSARIRAFVIVTAAFFVLAVVYAKALDRI